MPSLIVVNLSNDGYFLPLGTVETERHLLDFLNGVLDNSIQVGPDSRFTRKMMEIQQLCLIIFKILMTSFHLSVSGRKQCRSAHQTLHL